MSKEKESKEPKKNNLATTLSELRKEFGDGAVLQGNQIVKVDTISTNAISLDIALGVGGIPKGRVTEIYGPEASGKTTLCLELIANVQKSGGVAAFIDVEHALDFNYAQNGLGVDIDKLLFSQPDSGEQALTIAEKLAKSGEVDIIVIDSVAALVPQAELDGEMGDQKIGAGARLMSKAMRKLTSIVSKTGTAMIFTNQLREKIGVMFGSPETTPGGKALKYYASVRLDIRRLEALKEKDENDNPLGSRVRVKVVKNKVASPFRKGEFDIIFGEGIDKMSCLVETAEHYGLVKRAGSSYKLNDKSFQGQSKLIDFLNNNPEVAKQLDSDIRTKFSIGVAVVAPVAESTTEDDDKIELGD